jgi:hypothetical protein
LQSHQFSVHTTFGWAGSSQFSTDFLSADIREGERPECMRDLGKRNLGKH